MTNTITIDGNLVEDPELRFTSAGLAVCSFRIAHTPRKFDKATNDWTDGPTVWLKCSLWRQYAENVAESLQKGQKIIVTGRLSDDSYEAKDGTKRTQFKIDVDDVGPVLRNATVAVSKTEREGGFITGRTPVADDPWATSASSEVPF